MPEQKKESMIDNKNLGLMDQLFLFFSKDVKVTMLVILTFTKKLFVIPAFLIFMSAIPERTVQSPVRAKPQDSLKIDLLNHKLQKLDSLIQAT